MSGKEQSAGSRTAAKGLALLLIGMLVFTMISRAADALLVPQVVTEQPSAKIIEHVVKADATVEKTSETPVFTEEGLLVNRVYVEEGSHVREGDVLAEVLSEALRDKIRVLSDEITALKLTNDALAANEAAAKAAQEKEEKRAVEDYDRTMQQQMNAVALAQSDMDAAENAIHEMEAQDAAGALADFTEEEKKQKYDALWTDFFAKKAAYDTAVLAAGSAAEDASRAVEDAQAAENTDHTEEINALAIAQKEEALEKLLALQACGGQITAQTAGTVTGVFVSVGQKTPDTAAFTVAQTGENIRLTAQISKEDAKYVAEGDAATAQKGSVKQEGFTISAIRQNADGSCEVTFVSEETAEAFEIGDAVTVSVTKQSARYSAAVPTAALHVEQNGTYVYVIEERDTVLGTELFARKVQVDVLEKNSQYAAVEEGGLGMEDKVIVDSDRYVEEGDVVRLAAQ